MCCAEFKQPSWSNQGGPGSRSGTLREAVVATEDVWQEICPLGCLQRRGTSAHRRIDVFESIFGRLVGGAIWGLGAGVALLVFRGGSDGLRPAARSAIKTYLAASNRVRELTAETMENFEDLYAEARSERAHDGEEAEPRRAAAKPTARRAKARSSRAS